MKIVLTIFLSVSILVLGLSFLSPRSFEKDENPSGCFAKNTRYEGYSVQYKRRDFINERRLEKLEVLKGQRNVSQNATRSRHGDFMVFNNGDPSKTRYDDFR